MELLAELKIWLCFSGFLSIARQTRLRLIAGVLIPVQVDVAPLLHGQLLDRNLGTGGCVPSLPSPSPPT